MERVSTLELPSSGRLAAWTDLYASKMSRVEFQPSNLDGFNAELLISQLGPLKLARLSVDSCSIERAQRHLSHSPRLYSFLLQARGTSIFCHYGQEAHLSEGDFVLCDTGMPHHFRTAEHSETVMVRVTPEVLREYLPSPEQYCGRHLGRAVGVTHTVAAMVKSLADSADFRSCGDYESRIANHLLEMISMSYSMGFETRPTASAAAWRRRNDVVRYIEDHLRNPALTAESVAEGVHLSSRHLRTIFQASGEKVSAYILRRRLEECARRLRDPAWNGETLMKIAFSWGFNSAAHFTRSFRNHYGASPREFRRATERRA